MMNLILTFLLFMSTGIMKAEAIRPAGILPEIQIKQNAEGTENPLKPKKRERRRAGRRKISTTMQTEKVPAHIEHKVEKIIEAPPVEEPANIELNFENADLRNMVDYIADLFSVSFITDDAITPMLSSGKGVSGNKITFRSERPMTKKEVWSIFSTFLDIAGLSVAETPQPFIYRITSSPNSLKLPLQTFIGVAPDLLPDNDTRIRYVYFLANATVDSIRPIIEQLKSTTSSFTSFVSMRALIITDKSYNIKALMKIVLELDKATLPETMSVIKLKYASAQDVENLYKDLIKPDDQRGMVAKIFGAKKQTESFFFPENTRLIIEPRTNSVILLGTQDTINKLETFISKVDTQLTEEISPLYIYELQHTDAKSMADIMSNVTKYGINTTVGKAGGVQDGEKYFKPITFTPETSGNRLIVKGDYEDYIKAKEIIEKLDVPQPQVAIEVLVVDVETDQTKVLGTQWRNKSPNTFTKNVNMQTSGLIRSGVGASPVVDQTTGSIMANLISLATGNEPGSTLLSLGPDGNIWAIFKILQNTVDARIVSNPFLTTTNKYKATVSLGQTRRVNVGTVVSGGNSLNSQDDLSANLEVIITPQINSDGIVIMDVSVQDDQFTNQTNFTDATRTTKHVDTKAALANREILAIGGLIQTTVTESETKVPVLGDIPIIGWFFKNRQKEIIRSNLLIFISPQIVKPLSKGGMTNYTSRKVEYSRETLKVMDDKVSQRDPIHRWFFQGEPATIEVDQFIEDSKKISAENLLESSYYPNKTTHARQKLDRNVDQHVIKNVPTKPAAQQEVPIKDPLPDSKGPATYHNLHRHHKRSLTSMITPKDKGALV